MELLINGNTEIHTKHEINEIYFKKGNADLRKYRKFSSSTNKENHRNMESYGSR